jgi:hypothetical protein
MKNNHTLLVRIFALAIISSIMLGCNKDRNEPVSRPTPELSELNGYDPAPDLIPDLIRKQHRVRENYLIGAKSNDDVRLDIGLWMNEALMNHMKGDANRYGDVWQKGTVTYSFPVAIKSDGQFYVENDELIPAYERAMTELEAQGVSAKVHSLNHTIISVVDGIATVAIDWADGTTIESIPEPSDNNGSNYPCSDVNYGAIRLTKLLRFNYHEELPIGSYTVSLTDPFFSISTLTSTGFVNGNLMYLGTNENIGGPQLLYSGPNNENVICFPDRWNKLENVRTQFIPTFNIPSHLAIVREEVSWGCFARTGTPFSYGSIYYPMGPCDHEWFPTIGYIVHPFTL